ncbi:conserved repeat domain-containing protein [Jatrophihabitans endophyticus]|uniref:Conserved repeat domain-containing protein n=1 Tax=Jatrophihabitans endophyticus TaxID=1206085 RepID=A0A1M5L7V2_9ACTN|nr:DUF58 domain-containing protein [Jatrophihabitans endophyticus]SHG61194.1 conserved repeat domain-containing protein [Jatrophihabitans endophyticus]
MRRRIGFTTRASCLLAAGLTAVLCGLVLGETDLVRAGVLAVAVPFAAAVFVHRSRVRVASRRGLEPHRVTAGQAVTVHLTLTNRSPLPSGALMLEDRLPQGLPGNARFVLDSLAGHESRTVSYRTPDLHRGRYRVGPVSVRLNDPFHMVDVTRSFTATSDFLVQPVVDQLPAAQPPRSDDLGDGGGSHSIGAHGADDASTREYRIGDDLRKIHWRSSARVGSLMVRQEERPWRSQTTLLLDSRATSHTRSRGGASATGDDPRLLDSFEWAVSATASIAVQAMRRGREIGLLDDPTRPELLRFTEREQLTTHLAGSRPVPTDRFDPLADLVRGAARESTLVAVLGRTDPATLRLLAEARGRGRSSPALALLIDVDGWGDAAGGRPADDPEIAATVLRNAGWRATVVRYATSTATAWQLLAGAGSSPLAARS